MTDNYPKIPSSEITPEHLYRSRRRFLKGASVAAMAAVLAACGVPGLNGAADAPTSSPGGAAGPTPGPGLVDELGAPANSWKQITTYNNFYEFTTSKTKVAPMAQGYPTDPWKVEVGGLVDMPRTFDLDDLRQFEEEERIYRLRCVEAWSMVIPWQGFPLSRLLKAVQPTSEASYVRFQTIYDPENLPGQRDDLYQWPYIEGLRMDEAMNELSFLAVGMYENASRYPFQTVTQPGLNFSGDGRENNQVGGYFEILEIEYDEANKLQHFAANYLQYGEKQLSSWTLGKIRYKSTIPLSTSSNFPVN